MTEPSADNGETGALLVFTTLPDMDVARRIATSLVEDRLAACVNILPAGTSVYAWNGKIQEDTEHVLIIKTSRHCLQRLQAALLARHPYELPEIVAIPITEGLPAYLQWIEGSTSS